MPRLITAFVWVTLVCAGGCTAINPTSDHSQPVSSSEFCGRMAEVACDAYFGCCMSALPDTSGNRRSCLDGIGMFCARNYATIAADPRTGFSETEAARVMAEGARIADECSDDVFEWFSTREGLLSALAGTVPGGGECTPNSFGPDDFDAAALFSCEDGLACALSPGSDPVRFDCLARRAEGQGCFLSYDCQDALHCAYSPDGRGRCAPRLADGLACDSSLDCESLNCPITTGVCSSAPAERFFCSFGAATI